MYVFDLIIYSVTSVYSLEDFVIQSFILQICIVLEYMDGGSLADVLKKVRNGKENSRSIVHFIDQLERSFKRCQNQLLAVLG